MNTKYNRYIGYFYIVASAVLFSLAGILMKLSTWSSFTINGWRNLFAFIVMAIYLKSIKHKIIINKVVLIGAALNLATNLTFAMAIKLTTAANAIVLQFTEPIFLILFLFLFWKRKPDRKAVIACIMVFAGVLCFFLDKLSPEGKVGNIVAIISGAFYALVFLIKKMKNSDLESSILISQIASIVLFTPWLMTETDFRPVNFILVILLGVFQLGLAYIFFVKGLDRVSPVAASLTSTIEPILNPIWVALFYGETLSLIAIIGAAIVILSATAYNVSNARQAAPQSSI